MTMDRPTIGGQSELLEPEKKKRETVLEMRRQTEDNLGQ